MVNTLPRAGVDSWVLYAPETTFASAVTPTTHLGIVQSVTPSNKRGLVQVRGFNGTTTGGRELFKALGGKFETSLSIELQPQHFDWLKYVLGTRTGSGTSADNYIYRETITGSDSAGTANKLTDSTASFDANTLVGARAINTTDNTQTTITARDSGTVLSVAEDIFDSAEDYVILIDRLTSLTLSTNIELGTTDREWAYLGMKVNSCTIKSAIGEPVTVTLELIGADVDQDTSLASAVALSSADPYYFIGSKFEMSNGTISDNGDQTFTGSDGGTNTTDNTSIFKEGAGATDDKGQNLLTTGSNTTKTWTIANLASVGNVVTATNPSSCWIYIKDATELAKFASSGTCLELRYRTNGDGATLFYSLTKTRSQLVVGWNYIETSVSVNALTQGGGGAASGTLNEFVIIITTNAGGDAFTAGEVVYDLLRESSYVNNIVDSIELTITNNVEVLYSLGSFVGQSGVCKGREHSLKFSLKTLDNTFATFFLGGATDVTTPTEISSVEITLGGSATQVTRFLYSNVTLDEWSDAQTMAEVVPEEITGIAESLKVFEQSS